MPGRRAALGCQDYDAAGLHGHGTPARWRGCGAARAQSDSRSLWRSVRIGPAPASRFARTAAGRIRRTLVDCRRCLKLPTARIASPRAVLASRPRPSPWALSIRAFARCSCLRRLAFTRPTSGSALSVPIRTSRRQSIDVNVGATAQPIGRVVGVVGGRVVDVLVVVVVVAAAAVVLVVGARLV